MTPCCDIALFKPRVDSTSDGSKVILRNVSEMVCAKTDIQHKGEFVERIEPRRPITQHDILTNGLILRKQTAILEFRIDSSRIVVRVRQCEMLRWRQRNDVLDKRSNLREFTARKDMVHLRRLSARMFAKNL